MFLACRSVAEAMEHGRRSAGTNLDAGIGSRRGVEPLQSIRASTEDRMTKLAEDTDRVSERVGPDVAEARAKGGGESSRIGILSHVGNRNLGEEATITAVLSNLRSRFPSAEFVGFTIRPADTRRRHSIPAFPLRRGIPREPSSSLYERRGRAESSARDDGGNGSGGQVHDRPRALRRLAAACKKVPGLRPLVRFLRSGLRTAVDVVAEVPFLAKSYRRVRKLDLLLIVGTQQVRDFPQGPWRYPLTLLKWTVLARLAGVPVACAGIGAGRVTTRIGRLQLRWALEMADYRSFRDPGSRDIVRELGVGEDCEVVPDLALSLPTGSEGSSGVERVVGINVLPFLDPSYWKRHDPAGHSRYVAVVADFSRWLLEHGYSIRLFPTHPAVDPEIGLRVLKQMRERAEGDLLAREADRIHPLEVSTVQELRRELSRMDFVVSTRYHGVIFGILERRPVLGLSYGFKFGQLARMMGTSEFIVDAEAMDAAELIDRFRKLARNEDRVRSSQMNSLLEIQEDLQGQYDRLLSLRRDGRTGRRAA